MDVGAPLSIEVVNYDDSHVIYLRGELDASCAAGLSDRLDELAHSTVTVDLRDLMFIDAAGLGALISARNRIVARGDDLTLVNARGLVHRVILLGGAEYLLQ